MECGYATGAAARRKAEGRPTGWTNDARGRRLPEPFERQCSLLIFYIPLHGAETLAIPVRSNVSLR